MLSLPIARNISLQGMFATRTETVKIRVSSLKTGNLWHLEVYQKSHKSMRIKKRLIRTNENMTEVKQMYARL